MARIKIENLPKDARVSTQELKAVTGGWKVEEGESYADVRMLPVGLGLGMTPRPGMVNFATYTRA